MPDDDRLLRAFVEGAKWWEWQTVGATMWQSDQRLAAAAAEERLKQGLLGTPRETALAPPFGKAEPSPEG